MSDSKHFGTPSGDDRPAPGAGEKFERLQALLREMFQLDRGDLDFGLYRIMNLKSAEIAAFLENDLLPQVKDKLNLITAEQIANLKDRMLEVAMEASRLGFEPEDSPVMQKLRARLTTMEQDKNAEADVYNHLATFFSRYYAEGDFISQRRYSSGGRAAYLIPYDGEEVKLHWANADQYYVKTTENYAAYAFAAGAGAAARRVRFEIAAADNEKDNVKEANGRQRRFVLARGEGAVAAEDDELVVRFEHRPLTDSEKRKWPGNNSKQQSRINETAAERILSEAGPEWLPLLGRPEPTQANGERTLLAKHIERYTAKNSFDYFIHKDLGGFLRRELDLYLNTEALSLDDLDQGDIFRFDRALARVQASRHVGLKIIDFLAQLEDFQKRLWLKKKFVVETNWCVTLDRVPEALYPEIAANEAQCGEWVELFAVDAVAGDLTNGNTAWSSPPSAAFLKANPYLVLDTRHFDGAFRDRLLAALSDAGPLDEQTDGLLVHGENFQALNLLQARYRGQVQCVYIDPPYNTGDSEILYKNGYLKSSWLALMANRLAMTPGMLAPDSALFIAIDDFEMADLAKLIDAEYPSLRREMIVVNHHPQGGKAQMLAHTHEYMLVCVDESSNKTLTGQMRNEDIELRPFKRSGTAESNFRYARPNSFYAILVDTDSHKVVGIEPPPTGGEYPTEPKENNIIRVYPTGTQGEERVWRRSYESCAELVCHGKLRCSIRNTIYQVIESEERMAALFSNWIGPRYNAGTYGANLLRDIIGEQNTFSYPKSIHTVGDAIFAARVKAESHVLDYFAGSGTTGHAVINLNREDGGRRKYVLIEMADYFDTVLLPRMKKIVHSQDWKDGKPVSRKGVSQLFQYVRLESYEDTMDSLEVVPRSDAQEALLAENPEMAEDYRLRYALETETNGSACLLGKYFADPFAYTLSVVSGGMRRETPVDLPATFNYLLGLRVESLQSVEGVLAIEGADSQKRKCLILWRNLEGTSNTALEAWFVRNRERFAAPLDVIYANGDHTLNAMRQPGDTWKAEGIEPVFRELMFEEVGDGR